MTDRPVPRAVLDTNVFVAAGFNRQSSSAKILELVSRGEVELVWSEATRAETKFVLEKIPRLGWADAEPLFRPSGQQPDPEPTDEFDYVEDPDDRKFAALAKACGATLVSSDDHLLAHRARSDISIASPGEFLSGHMQRPS
jgi:uncharacterized protein